MHNISERCLFWFHFQLHRKSLWNSACMPVFSLILFPRVCMNARGLGGCWFIWVFQAFLALTHSARLVPHHQQRGVCSRSTYGKRREIFWGQREKFYILWYISLQRFQYFGRGKCFYFFFYFFKHQSFDFCSGWLFQGSHCYFLEQSHCQWKSVICTVLLFL